MSVKNLKVLGLALCINATLLTGCKAISVDLFNQITYSNDKNGNTKKVYGNLTYELIDSSVRVTTLESSGVETTRLVYSYSVNAYDDSSYTYYVDLETGTDLIKYRTYKNVKEYYAGESIDIVSEENFLPYLLEDDNIKEKYPVSELVDIFNEKVKNNKTKIK